VESTETVMMNSSFRQDLNIVAVGRIPDDSGTVIVVSLLNPDNFQFRFIFAAAWIVILSQLFQQV
jgi:hypothetical protein